MDGRVTDVTKVGMVHCAGTDQEHCEDAYIDLAQISYVGVTTRASKLAVGSDQLVIAYPITLGPHDMWIVDGPWRRRLIDPAPRLFGLSLRA